MAAPRINRYPITMDGETAQIGTANELAVALDVLQGQHDREALSQLSSHLAEVVGNAIGFLTVMRSLSIDDQLFLIQSIGPAEMPGVIQNARHLRDILATLADQIVEEALISTLGQAGLQRLILTGTELAEVLEWVYGECDALVLDLLGDDALRRLCRYAADLSAVLHALDFVQQASLLERLGWPFVVGLVMDGRDLAYLLRALPPQNSAQLLKHFTCPQLKALIANADDWEYLYRRLEPSEAELLVALLDLH